MLNIFFQVDDLKAKLAAQEVELKARSETTEKLLVDVGRDTEKVGAEKDVADEEEKKVRMKHSINNRIGTLHTHVHSPSSF